MALRSVVLAGGGTGGHIYPLLAFADAVKRHFPEVRITTLGSPKGMENELIPPAGYDLRVIPAFQLPRAINLNLLRTPDRMYKSAHAAGQIIDEVQADVVVGFGGYVSVPAYLAAWRRELRERSPAWSGSSARHQGEAGSACDHGVPSSRGVRSSWSSTLSSCVHAPAGFGDTPAGATLVPAGARRRATSAAGESSCTASRRPARSATCSAAGDCAGNVVPASGRVVARNKTGGASGPRRSDDGLRPDFRPDPG